VSYAQNFEDVIIRRALQDIASGFYIDIGAFDGTADSVTRWFYDQGWHGVNVEPNPDFHENLKRDRPRDENLWCAISSRSGRAEFDIIGNTGLSTLLDGQAAVAKEAGYGVSRRLEVPVQTLDELLESYARDRTVDFLKIDAEGSEGDILNAAHFAAARPRLVLVEAVKSFSVEPSWETWEPNLLAQGFRFVWFDGINRFYLREEDAWREQFFGIPPSVFDNFTVQSYAAALLQVEERQKLVAALESEKTHLAAGLELERAEAARRLDGLSAHLAESTAQCGEFQGRAQDLVRRLGERDTELTIIQSQLAGKVSHCEALEAASQDLIRRLGALDAELAAHAAKHAALKAANEDVTRRLNLREAELAAKAPQVEALQAGHQSLAARLNEHERELSAPSARCATLQTECQGLSLRLSDRERAMADQESAMLMLSLRLDAQRMENRELSRQHAEKAAIIEQKQVDLSRVSQLLGRRESELADLAAEMAKMATRLSEISRAKLEAEQARDALLASASWRITKPVRALARLVQIPSRRGI
jgi:FkbM family methyltransferase